MTWFPASQSLYASDSFCFCFCFPFPGPQLQSCHGWRTIENLRRFVPSLSEEDLPGEVTAFESRIWQIADEAKKAGRSDGQILAMPGAAQLLSEVCTKARSRTGRT